MRNSILTIILGLFVLQSLYAQQNIKFPIKSGVIKYNSTGLSIGSTVLYFDNFGNRIREDYNGTIWDQDISSRTIVKNDQIFLINMLEKTYTIEEMSPVGLKIYEEFYFDEEKYSENGFIRESQEVILNKNCFVYSSIGENIIKIWVWKGLILKKEDDFLGGSVFYATSIQESFPDKKTFDIPEEFERQ